jgi:predicted DNA-binding transcriptional regulator AlpA
MQLKSQYQTALENFDTLPDSANVRIKTVQGLYACSIASVWRNTKLGYIPKPRKLTARTTVWNVGELRASLAAKGL